jgi:hypothetical protein
VNRTSIALRCLATGGALALALVVPASAQATPTAATAGTRTAPAAPAALKPALVPAHGRPVTRTASAPGGALPAANQDGACNSLANGDGDFCLWFSTNFVGSLSDFFTSDANLGDNTFLTPGLGLGSAVANNSESALNADSNLSVIVFTGGNGTGTAGVIGPRQFGNFNTTFMNSVESFRFA